MIIYNALLNVLEVTVEMCPLAKFLVCSALALPLIAQNIDEDLWRDAEDQIHDAIAGHDKDFDKKYLLQLSNFPLYATWHLPDSQYSLYMVANSVPRWTPKWVWQTGRRFDDAYGIFVDGLDIDALTNPAQDKHLSDLAKDWVNKQNLVVKERTRLEKDWTKYHTKYPNANKDSWWGPRSAQLSTYQTAANIAFAHYNAALPANARTVVAIISRYDKALQSPVEVRLPASSSDASKRDSGGWPIAAQLPFIGSDDMLTRFAADGEKAVGHPESQTGWSIKRNRHHHAEDHTKYGGAVGWGDSLILLAAEEATIMSRTTRMYLNLIFTPSMSGLYQ